MSSVNPPAPNNPGQEKILMLILCLVLIAVVFWLYMQPIMSACISLLYYLWLMVDVPRFHAPVAERINMLAAAGNHVETLSWNAFVAIMNHTAGILLVPLVPVVFFGMMATRNHPLNRTRRAINVYTLPHIMSSWSPSIIPALCYGDPKTQLLNVDPPEHRSAQHPEEFATEHQLVVGQRLDRDRTTAVFQAQLGRPLNGPEDLNDHERALFAVFALASFMQQRKQAENLLATLNRSCRFKRRKSTSKRGYPDLDRADVAFKKVLQHPEAAQWFTRYSTTRTCLSALHDQDVRLPGASFRWLKGLDRPLWYALTSTGRSKVFIEGAGIIAVARWEKLVAGMATRLTIVIPVPDECLDIAVDALNEDLQSIGVVAEDHDLTPEKSRKDEDPDEEEDTGEVVDLQATPQPVASTAPLPVTETSEPETPTQPDPVSVPVSPPAVSINQHFSRPRSGC